MGMRHPLATEQALFFRSSHDPSRFLTSGMMMGHHPLSDDLTQEGDSDHMKFNAFGVPAAWLVVPSLVCRNQSLVCRNLC